MKSYARRNLPSMTVLNSFMAAAHFGSFSRAGEEIGLTQGAVSRQIANLEAQVGSLLFDRNGRRVSLNARGRAYYEELGPALSQIRRATSRAMLNMSERVVELAVLPSFGMRWLIPRLSRLSERHPDLIVNISAQSDEFDFDVETYDAAIHVGCPDWPGAIHDILFPERVVPVISPELLRQHPVEHPKDLLDLPLLAQSARLNAWDCWFAACGVTRATNGPVRHIEHWLMLAQAVAAGTGVALIPTFVIESELASGTLVVPIDLPLEEGRAYYLVYPEDRRNSPAIAALRDWMMFEVSGDPPSV